MCLFTSALRASVNKSHIPSLPQNNLYIFPPKLTEFPTKLTEFVPFIFIILFLFIFIIIFLLPDCEANIARLALFAQQTGSLLQLLNSTLGVGVKNQQRMHIFSC